MSKKKQKQCKFNDKSALRLDKWLWAARFFKTRQLAITAIKGGKVDLNGKRAKPAHVITEGDELAIRRGPYEFCVVVTLVSKHRGSAQVAQTMYEEKAASIKKREQIQQQIMSQPRNPYGGRKPDKHTQRATRGAKRNFWSD